MKTKIAAYFLAFLVGAFAMVAFLDTSPANAQGKGDHNKKGTKKAAPPPAVPDQFCWRASYGRGAGTIPTGCPAGTENDAALCYGTCKAGYKGVGPVCWGHCPAGWTDHGVGCTKPAPYGRGGGYPWQFGDALNDSGMLGRCRGANPAGCEMDGAIAYPVCKPGFRKIGCCICSPSCPEGFTDTGATCVKTSYGRSAGTIPNACGAGQQNDAGLCYGNCRAGFGGIGPVCWGSCGGATPVNCGAGCANTAAACNNKTTDQVLSVVELVANVALAATTGGAANAAKTGGKAAAASGVAATKAASKGITKEAARAALLKASKSTGKALTEQQLQQASAAASGEDWDPYSLDPTGIASIVKAYNHSTCN